jgi:hypothetical protein
LLIKIDRDEMKVELISEHKLVLPKEDLDALLVDLPTGPKYVCPDRVSFVDV